MVENIFRLLNIQIPQIETNEDHRFLNHLSYMVDGQCLCTIGVVMPTILKQFDLKKSLQSLIYFTNIIGFSYVPSMLDARNVIMDPNVFTHQTDILGDSYCMSHTLLDCYPGTP